MNKKKRLIIAGVVVGVIVLGVVLFFLYRNFGINKALTKAIELMSEKEYNKSLGSLELVLDDSPNNKEALEFKIMIEKYLYAKKLFDEGRIEEASKEIKDMNESYSNVKGLKEDVDALKNEIDEYVKAKGDQEFEKLHQESKKAEYIEKLNGIEEGLSDLDYLYEGTTIDMKQAASQKYTRWDNALNEIYNLLKEQLSKSEMDKLTQKQVEWISYRDSTAKNESLKFEGGTMEGLEYMETIARLTKERCYELVNNYMK